MKTLLPLPAGSLTSVIAFGADWLSQKSRSWSPRKRTSEEVGVIVGSSLGAGVGSGAGSGAGAGAGSSLGAGLGSGAGAGVGG